MSINDEILRATGGPTVNDGLATHFAKDEKESLQDAERGWLIGQGGTGGAIADMWLEVFGPGALGDVKLAYWKGQPSAGGGGGASQQSNNVLTAEQINATRVGYRDITHGSVKGDLSPNNAPFFHVTRIETRSNNNRLFMWGTGNFTNVQVGPVVYTKAEANFNGVDRWRWDIKPAGGLFVDGQGYPVDLTLT